MIRFVSSSKYYDSWEDAKAHKPTKKWSRIKYPDSYIRYLIWLSTLLFLTFSIEYLEIPLELFYIIR